MAQVWPTDTKASESRGISPVVAKGAEALLYRTVTDLLILRSRFWNVPAALLVFASHVTKLCF